MTETLKLILPFPPSANRYWRSAPGKGLVPSAEAEAYKQLVARTAPRNVALFGDVRVVLNVFRPRRTGDLDNCQKVLFDALRGIAFLDDAQVKAIIAERFDDPGDPRVELVLKGERFATTSEIDEHARKVAETKRKRRATRRRNAAAKAYRLTPNVVRGGRP